MIPDAKGVASVTEASAASVLDKLNRYLLDPDHVRGGQKAQWFEQALGFNWENAADLAKQLVFDESLPCLADFLTYLAPRASKALALTALAGTLPLLVFFLGALFRRRWKMPALFAATFGLLYLFFTDAGQPFRFWLIAQGFRIHAGSIDNYLSRCRLTKFSEKGTAQAVGDCEWSGMDSAPVDYVVFYDTTDEIALRTTQRSPEWYDAMWHYPPKALLRDGAPRAERMVGHFYRIHVLAEELDG